MLRASQLATAVVLLLAAFAQAPAPVHADTRVYQLVAYDPPGAGSIVSGTITTDGTLGTGLDPTAIITDYIAILLSGFTTTTIDFATNGLAEYGATITATDTELTLDAGTDSAWCLSDTCGPPNAIVYEDFLFAPTEMNVLLYVHSGNNQGLVGSRVIANASPVPTPTATPTATPTPTPTAPPGSDVALFRVEQSWHNIPDAPLTTPGGAGIHQGYILPYLTKTMKGGDTYYIYPPAAAIVESGNPIGGAFTLPTGFINRRGAWSITPKTSWPGYTTYSYLSYYNGPGKFGPNHGATGPTRIVFPTTMGNPSPTYNGTLMKWIGGNHGDGNPVTPTTTFDGRYDLSRGGSIAVTPGPRRFGGTFRLFYGPSADFYQYIYKFSPAFYKGYADFICFDEGKFGCTPGTFASDIGDTTAIYQFTRFLLNVKGTGTGDRFQSGTAKATTATGKGGWGYPTVNGQGTPSGAPASYITGMQRYLNLIHPWTTGFARVHNAKAAGKGYVITPQAQGYDISLGGADITVTRYDWGQVWNKTLSATTTATVTTKQYLYGVERVVSMVRPRLIHTYRVAGEPGDPITNTWQVARMWRLKVFFLPEPAGMLLVGVGVATLLGLSRIRRR